MADPRNQHFYDDENNDAAAAADGGLDRSHGEEFEASRSSSGGVEDSSAGSASRSEIGLQERLTEILVDEGDGDLLLQQSNREERVLEWLQALDMQIVGACRTDERLKPLLKMNASNGLAEDRLLAQLSQHFELAEVGMLARCFCIPLVSMRVGKINKQGTLLCPTGSRGNLNLTVLPTSDLRLSFIGDHGQAERLLTLSCKSQCSAITVNEITADRSGRSFLIKVPDGQVFYFWCSEKSKLLGAELLAKMNDILARKPSIAELTGISESRLSCFMTDLRAYLVGSTVGVIPASLACPSMHQDARDERSGTAQAGLLSSTLSKSPRSRHIGSLSVRTNSSFQGSLSPRSSSFKEGMSRNLSSFKNAARDKLRRHGDNYLAVDDVIITSSVSIDGSSSSNQIETDKFPEIVRSCSLPPSCFLDSLGKLAAPPSLNSESQVSFMGSPLLSPYYCWCPPGVSTLRCPDIPLQLPSSSVGFPSLPPLSSLLPASMPSSLFTQTPPFNLVDTPSIDFPSFLPDPLVRFPRPTSQQIPTFTPLMCDPIVHIPVIDICSSGQGYLVSAGPTITTTIPPLLPNLVNPLIPKSDSMVEKGARETLRLLISGSSQTNPPLMDVLPAVLTNANDNPSMLVTGSRGLYGGTRDVNVIASSIAAIGLVSLSGRSDMEGTSRYSSGRHIFDLQEEGSSGLNSSCSDDVDAISPVTTEERMDQ